MQDRVTLAKIWRTSVNARVIQAGNSMCKGPGWKKGATERPVHKGKGGNERRK